MCFELTWVYINIMFVSMTKTKILDQFSSPVLQQRSRSHQPYEKCIYVKSLVEKMEKRTLSAIKKNCLV